MKPSGKMYNLVIRELRDPGNVPVECRLRTLLKRLLRSLSFECRDIREIQEADKDGAK